MNKLKELRNQQRLTLDDIEAKTGIKRGTYSNYENNKTEPKIETWQRLADFFNVSVPYIQGLTYTTDEIIEVIHNFYFEKNKTEQIGTFNYEFVEHVNLYIRLTSYDHIPRDLYTKEAKTFPLTAKAKKYWFDHFKDILDSQRLQDINKGNDDEVIVSFDNEVENVISKFQSPYKLTLLGQLYQSKFKNENEMHNKTIQEIKYLDLASAKEAINEYANLVNDLKNKVNNFKEDSFKAKDYNKNFIQDIKNQVYMMNLTSDKLVEKIANELISRIKKGDMSCRDYIVEHNNSDFIEAYGNYKKEHGEDTTDTDKYIRERDDITGKY